MTRYIPYLLGVAVSVTAQAETCQLHSLDTAASSPRMVRVYDADTKNIVFEGSVAGGVTISIPVSGTYARYEYKYPQDAGFHTNVGFSCKTGETTNF